MDRRTLKVILDRLKEPGTWRGIQGAMLAMGVTMPDQTWQTIVMVGCLLAGLIQAILPEPATKALEQIGPRDEWTPEKREAVRAANGDHPEVK